MHRSYLFLLPLAALLGACGSASQQESDTHATRLPQPAAVPATAAPDSGSRAVAPAADSATAAGRPERLVLLPVSANIGPQTLQCELISHAGLPREQDGRLRGTPYWGGRLLLTRPDSIYNDDVLLLRYDSRDTTWLQLPLSVSGDYHFSEPRHPDVQVVNLDRQGPPEIMVYFFDEAHGAGGGTSEQLLNVFTLEANQPRLLLRAMVSSEDESHTSSGGAWHTTTERTVRLRGGDIELGAPESYASEGTAPAPKDLPGPPPGRYRYQRGRLYRVETVR